MLLHKGFHLAWHGLFSGDGQLIRSYHSAHGRVEGLPQVRGVTINLKKNRPWSFCQAIFLGAAPGQGSEGAPLPRGNKSIWDHCWHYPQGGARDLPHSHAVELIV